MIRIMRMAIVISILMLIPGAAYASEPEKITIQEAIELALKNSSDLRQAEYDVEAAEITRDEVWDAYNVVLRQTYIPGTDLHLSIPSDSELEKSVYATNLQWLIKRKNLEMKIDTLVTSVYQKYYAVLQAAKKVDKNRILVEQDKQQLLIAQARLEVGMETPFNVSQLRAKLEASEASLETANNELINAYCDLNELLGLPLNSRPVLVDTATYEALDIDNPEEIINSIADNSPLVWIAQENVRFAEQTRGMNQFSSYELDKAELNKAKANLDLTKEQMRQGTRAIYYNIKNLEELYKGAYNSLQVSREALRLARIKYDLGMATFAEVTAAEANYAEAEYNLFALICQHSLMKIAFHKPWTAGVVTGGQTGIDVSSANEG